MFMEKMSAGVYLPPPLGYIEACIGYFVIRDIGPFFKGYWDICVFYFGIWDIQEFWDMGYWNLFWDTS